MYSGSHFDSDFAMLSACPKGIFGMNRRKKRKKNNPGNMGPMIFRTFLGRGQADPANWFEDLANLGDHRTVKGKKKKTQQRTQPSFEEP